MTLENPNRPRKSLLRNLGEFFGHIAHGIKTPAHGAPLPPNLGGAPSPPPRASGYPVTAQPPIVRQETHEQEVLTPQGKMVLRRTVIDEVRPADNQP